MLTLVTPPRRWLSAAARVSVVAVLGCQGSDGDVLVRRAPGAQAKLLSAGQHTPRDAADLAYLRQNIAALEAAVPFDGIMVDIGFSRTTVTTRPLVPAE